VEVFSSASDHLTTPEALDALHGWSVMLSDATDAGMALESMHRALTDE
jgi:hypothetical protein